MLQFLRKYPSNYHIHISNRFSNITSTFRHKSSSTCISLAFTLGLLYTLFTFLVRSFETLKSLHNSIRLNILNFYWTPAWFVVWYHILNRITKIDKCAVIFMKNWCTLTWLPYNESVHRIVLFCYRIHVQSTEIILNQINFDRSPIMNLILCGICAFLAVVKCHIARDRNVLLQLNGSVFIVDQCGNIQSNIGDLHGFCYWRWANWSFGFRYVWRGRSENGQQFPRNLCPRNQWPNVRGFYHTSRHR